MLGLLRAAAASLCKQGRCLALELWLGRAGSLCLAPLHVCWQPAGLSEYCCCSHAGKQLLVSPSRQDAVQITCSDSAHLQQRQQQQDDSANHGSQSRPAGVALASQHQRHCFCGSCGGSRSAAGGLPVQRGEVLHVPAPGCVMSYLHADSFQLHASYSAAVAERTGSRCSTTSKQQRAQMAAAPINTHCSTRR